MQLQCHLYMKENIHTKLGEHELPSSVSEKVLSDILGKHVYNRWEEGLNDADNSFNV